MKNTLLALIFIITSIGCHKQTIVPDSNIAIPKSSNSIISKSTALPTDNVQKCYEKVFVFIAQRGDGNIKYVGIFQKYPNVQAIFNDEEGTWGIVQPIPDGIRGVKKGNCITTTINVIQIIPNDLIDKKNGMRSGILAKILDWF